MLSDYHVRPSNDADREWIPAFTREHWGAEYVVAHGVIYVPHRLPGFVAENQSGAVVGLATYVLERQSCELVTLNAVPEGTGIGSALLRAVVAAATNAGCTRLWLVTTNDNLNGLAFYQKRGLHIIAVHTDALARARRIKPSIPLVGANGILLRDEIELQMLLVP